MVLRVLVMHESSHVALQKGQPGLLVLSLISTSNDVVSSDFQIKEILSLLGPRCSQSSDVAGLQRHDCYVCEMT